MRNYDAHSGVIDAPTPDSPGSATAAPDRSPDVSVQLGTHFFRQRYLFAFATQAELLQYVRTQSSDTDANRQAEIMEAWAGLQERVAHLLQTEAEVADTIKLTAIPQEYRTTLEGFAADPLFQKSFSTLPTAFGLVEIDKLVAAQRTVNLEYVDRLVASLPPEPSMGDLLEVCVSPKRKMDPIQHLEIIGQPVHVFSSPNSDIRFLGAFVKPLDAEDLGYAVMGGIPAAAVIAFVGYGAAPVNVLQVGRRVVLNNGFHRVYALRSRGVTEISSSHPAGAKSVPRIPACNRGAAEGILVKRGASRPNEGLLRARFRDHAASEGQNQDSHDRDECWPARRASVASPAGARSAIQGKESSGAQAFTTCAISR